MGRRWLGGTLAAVAVAAASSGCGSGLRKSGHIHVARPQSRSVDVNIEVNGDILVHQSVWKQARRGGHESYDFRPMLAQIRPYLKHVDLAICHDETPITPRPPKGYPVFNTPTQLASAIHWAGYQICGTASNHSLDQGQYGIDQTGRALSAAGVLHAGSYPSASARRKPLIVTVKGVKVAFLAYTEMLNGFRLPHPWSVNLINLAAVKRDARTARRDGAQVVLVNFHWGTQFQSAPNHYQLSVARVLARDPDITAIVGQHVHVVQPIRRLAGKLVVFGEGQILSAEGPACCTIRAEDGMLVFLHIQVSGANSRLTSISYIPTWDRHPDYKVLPIGAAFARHEAAASTLRASYRRTVATVGRIPGVLEPIPAHLR